MARNPILIGTPEVLTPRYYVVLDEGNGFFKSGEELLQFLEKNDPIECGCKLMTDKDWAEIADPAF